MNLGELINLPCCNKGKPFPTLKATPKKGQSEGRRNTEGHGCEVSPLPFAWKAYLYENTHSH